MDTQCAARRGVRREERPLHAVGTTGDIKGLAGKNTQTFDAKGMTVVPGSSTTTTTPAATSCSTKCWSAIPSRSSLSPSAASSTSCGEGAADAARHLGRGLLLRRHQGEGQARAERPRPRRGVHRASGRRAPPRRPHVLLQQQGVRAGGVTKDTPNPMGGTFDNDDEGELTGRVTDLAPAVFNKVGATADVHAGGDRAARARRRGAHLQAVRPLRAHQRAPPGRRPAGDAGRARARRTAAPRQLRGERPRARRR